MIAFLLLIIAALLALLVLSLIEQRAAFARGFDLAHKQPKEEQRVLVPEDSFGCFCEEVPIDDHPEFTAQVKATLKARGIYFYLRPKKHEPIEPAS